MSNPCPNFLSYRLTNTVNGKVYIGITTRTLKHRLADHKELAASGANRKLFHAIRKYGFEAFTAEVIACSANPDDMLATERVLISQHDSLRNGYNMNTGGSGNCGAFITEATREKMRRSHIGKKDSPETKALKSAVQMGRPGTYHLRSEEGKQRHLDAVKNRVWTEEERKAQSERFKGRIFTPEWRAKISSRKKELKQGPSPEQSRLLSIKLKGRKKPPRSEEHAAKLGVHSRLWFALLHQHGITGLLRKGMTVAALADSELTKKFLDSYAPLKEAQEEIAAWKPKVNR